MSNRISIRKARQNNLKDVDIDLELNKITVITGISGSGKSSLAFDTVYAEGQRRYIESFSAYARQFMERMDKPQVKAIEGILPSIAINQTNPIKTSRSTLGTLTEITDYMKLLFPRLASLYCSQCGKPVEKDSSDSIAKTLLRQFDTQPCIITFPFLVKTSSLISFDEMEKGLRRQGFFRVFYQNVVQEISTDLLLSQADRHIDILADRLVISQTTRQRLIDSLETALKFGKGFTSIFFPGNSSRPLKFSTSLHCAHCNLQYKQPSANLFSFNSPLGACEHCNGFGKTIEVDIDAVIPNKTLSLRDDAIKPWSTPSYREAYYELISYCKKKKIPIDKPFKEISQKHKELIIHGTEEFYGIMGFFNWLETKTYKMHIRVLLSKYRAYETCPECRGTRFKKDALLYRIDKSTIADIYAMSITEGHNFFKNLHQTPHPDKTVHLLLNEITSRYAYLVKVGLGYLTPDRQSRTLSGGEVERASLTTALGSSLVNTLYVLDEPSIGLHPRDTRKLIDILKGLRDLGNTILVVEHDPDIIMFSDTVIDLGPSSGEKGGDIVFCGSPLDLTKSAHSLTGRYISGKLSIPLPASRRKPKGKNRIKINKVSHHNLKNISLSIPCGLLACITGVSGSGKSTLLEEVMYKSLSKKDEPSKLCWFEGRDVPENVMLMDQSPIGKTPRSNPVTYMKIFDTIRSLFAQTDLARERGYMPSTFSFNSSGGRCEQCQGDGYEKIEMQFLADIYVSCSSCLGTRYSPEVLDIKYKGKNIYDVLRMTVSEGRKFFADTPKAEYPLYLLEMVGLGYLRLGQPANTLSGGESQRLKLISFIRQGSSGKTLFLFDEPTTGLHFEDIKKLLQIFDYLLNQEHSIVVVEHNLEVIKNADHIIDLGPEGGSDGGYVVAKGSPEKIMQAPTSYTGAFLKKYLQHTSTVRLQAQECPPEQDTEISATDHIIIEGAREHNLKNISLQIPRENMVVITGLSGSGKSTLAFDILFAEGQRRFLETLSPYARQYIHQLKRPEVNAVRGLPPTVAIEQLFSRGGKKSTVATATEIYHYLRLLFAKVGTQHCPSCGKMLTSQTPQNIAEDILTSHSHDNVTILAPQVRGRKGVHKDIIQRAKKDGYEKIRIDGKIVRLQNIFAVKRYHEHQVELITAELTPSEASPLRVQEEVNKALAVGMGEMIIICRGISEKFYSIKSYCPSCKISMEEPDPRLFSFNSSHGACADCSGLGTKVTLTPEFLVTDKHKSISQGAIDALVSPVLSLSTRKKILAQIQNDLRISLKIPLTELSPAKYRSLFYGKKTTPGLIEIFDSPSLQKKSGWSEYAKQFYSETPCPECKGSRLNTAARSIVINNKSIAELVRMTADQLLDFLSSLKFSERQKQIAAPILQELLPKLKLLQKAGLSYLTLDRSADTLSGGESQRIRLAAQIASNLRGVAYVLDEPTIGLHPHDNKNLIHIIKELKQKGNSVIIVEHDEETIKNADFIVDLGIGGGTHGGDIVAAGTLSDIIQSTSSVTGAYLAGRTNSKNPVTPRSLKGGAYLKIIGAHEHNLNNITASFPIGRLSVVTGVSGSGKTTLVRETLYKGIQRCLGSYHGYTGAHQKITGSEYLKRIVEIDQSPIGKTPRSIPATYVGFYDDIRNLFSNVPEARIRGYAPGRFSFNLSGGRCEKCSGQGKLKVMMSFLPDMYVDCDVCRGQRFNDETLHILFKGKDISQVLAMTVEEGCDFFKGIPPIYKPLNILNRMGLGYLTLGQPSPTLSGGEAQRIKIASELCKNDHGKTLYILDEPTTGLHAADIEKLMEILQALVDLGNTIIIIEHNLEVIRQADYILDLGPGGGDQGGSIVAAGPPQKIALGGDSSSYTAGYLKQYLERHATCN